MALFKVFKGPRFVTATATGQIIDKLQSGKPQTNDGWAYFTEDDGKFYIDITTGDNAIIKDDQHLNGNRVPLNAYKADTLSLTLPISLGGTSATTAIEALSNLGGLTLLTRGIPLTTTDNINNLTTNGAYYSASTTITTSLQGDKPFASGFSLYQIQGYTVNAIKQFALASNIIKYRYKPVSSTDDSWSNWETLSTLTASSATVGSTNIPVYLSAGTITAGSIYAGGTLVNLNGSNMGATAVNIYAATSSGTLGLFLISSGENSAPIWVSNITVPGTLNVIGQTILNSNVTVDGLITTNELMITGLGTAQIPTAALHIATKGYVDNAISQGFAANDAMVFKGIVSSSSVFTNILNSTTAHYSAGWTYRADQNFTISNSTTAYYVEKGDLLIAIADKNTSTTNGVLTDWAVVEHNIDGGLYKSSTIFTDGAILLADGVAGKVKTGLLSTTTAVVITGISSTTASTTKITGNTSVTASKITSNNSVTVVTSVSLDSSTSTTIGSVVDGVLIIGEAVTDVGTITTGTATASQISATAVTATNTSYTATTVVTNTTSSTATVVASISIS